MGDQTGIFHNYHKAVSIRREFSFNLTIPTFTLALLSVIVGCVCIDSWTNLLFQQVFNEHSKLNGGSCKDDDDDDNG